MYTYIYIVCMYIYIHRILLNRSLSYTIGALFTQQSLRRTANSSAHSPHSLSYTERKKEKENGGGRRPGETHPPSCTLTFALLCSLRVYGGADPLAVDRVRRVIRSQGVESAVGRGGQGGRKRARRRLAVRMVSRAERTQRRRRIR